MRTYRCEDVTLSDRGIDSKGWLCNPQEKGKKPAILVLGPKDASNNTVLLQYATEVKTKRSTNPLNACTTRSVRRKN